MSNQIFINYSLQLGIKTYLNFICKKVNIKKGSGQTGIADPVASITKDQLIKIAKEKMPDLNTSDPEQASKIIAGTARSMGIEVK